MLAPVEIGSWQINAYAVLYSSFAIGSLMRLFVRASTAKRSPFSKYKTRREYIAENLDIYFVRTVFVGLIFSLWILHPGSLAKLLEHLWVPPSVADWVPIVPGIGSAWLGGYVGDKAIDAVQYRIGQHWPDANRYLKGEVPAYTEFAQMLVDQSAEGS